MNCWDILGLNPTNDEKEIRRAYAKKLKITRPDEDAEGYQQLREAFDLALQLAPFQSEAQEVVKFEADNNIEQAEQQIPSQSIVENLAIFDRSLIDIIAEMEQVYQQKELPEFYQSLENWFAEIERLNQPNSLELLLDFIRRNEIEIPSVWSFLDDHYHLTDLSSESSLLTEEESNNLAMFGFFAYAKYNLKPLERYLERISKYQNSEYLISNFWYYFQFEMPLLTASQRNRMRQNIALLLKKAPQHISDKLKEYWIQTFNFSTASYTSQNTEDSIAIRSPHQFIRHCERLCYDQSSDVLANNWQKLRPYLAGFDFNSQRELQKYFRFLIEHRNLPEKLAYELRQFIDQIQQKLVIESLDNPEQIQMSAGDVINQLQDIYLKVGEKGLMKDWENIRQLLTALPLDESEVISWRTYQFLKDNQIENGKIWTNFAQYFNWLSDYYFSQNLDLEDIEILKSKLQIAQEQNQLDELPITSKISTLNDAWWKKIIAFFYALLLYPMARAEFSPDKDSIHDQSWLNSLYYLAGFSRLIISVFIWLFLFRYFGQNQFEEIESLWISTIAYYLLCGVLGWIMIMAKNGLMSVCRGIFQSQWYFPLVGIFLPILFIICFPLFNEWLSEGALLFFWVLPFTASFQKPDKSYLAYILSSGGLIILLMGSELGIGLSKEICFFIAILWINVNIAYRKDKDKWHDIEQRIQSQFRIIEKDEDDKYPKNLIINLLMLLFFIPNYAAKFVERTQRLWLLHEFILAATLLLLLLDSQYYAVLLYPAILAVYALQVMVKILILRKV